ncbi:hypothetical protein MNBD_GAMMA21-1810 [hydrothermal vent metagenome]|uniref:HMA domain-containing protein n=1 Tax=hydrothermal vent metagenome TaxID=652676 RepID=A0A3B0ZTF6_9ZZZZ
MKKQILVIIFSMLLLSPAIAAGTHYEMRVDGLACPFCAFGIEKKLKALEGSSDISVDLDKGLVKVNMAEGQTLTEEQMTTLFNDSGFTYRSMKTTPIESKQ